MKSLNRSEYIELAKAYVALSNAHKLDLIFPMFIESASYQSSSVGSFEGKADIENMMSNFFTSFPDVHWQVAEYRYAIERRVEFDFVMTATNAQSGEKIERRGLETIQFNKEGFITSIRVEIP
jgi:hypothetical protein